MLHIRQKTYRTFQSWRDSIDGVVAAEFALIFPVMFFMLIGIWDIGNAVLTGQKVIAASQNVADLIAREISVNDDERDGAFMAGQLSMDPYDTNDMVIEILSVSYDDDDAPVEEWREIWPSGSTTSEDLLDSTAGLGTDGQGAVAVRITYTFTPDFGQYVVGDIHMSETTYTRGRKSALVARDEAEEE